MICVASCSLRLRLSQVLVASARARLLINDYAADMESGTPAALQRLLAWKETKVHQGLTTGSNSIGTA